MVSALTHAAPASPRTRRRALRLTAAWGLAFCAGWRTAPAAAAIGEYRIKAAFLCKFGHYVDWPSTPGPQVPFVIGVVADDVVAQTVTGVARGQTVHGRPIVVRHIERIAVEEAQPALAMVYVARSHHARLPALLEAVRGRPVLTVADAHGEADTGAMISFVVIDDKVKFDIALAHAEASQLRISARLLGVARQVIGRPTS